MMRMRVRCSCWHCQDECECWVHDCPSCAARCPVVVEEELESLARRIRDGASLEDVRAALLRIIDVVVDDFDEGWAALEKLAPELPHIGTDESPYFENGFDLWCWDDTRMLKWAGNRSNPEDGLRIVPRGCDL